MTEIVYEGRDLEALAFAPNYHRWILDLFRPYLGRRLAEIGAGSGNFSRLLLAERIESLDLVEPSPAMFGRLRAAAAPRPGLRIASHNAVFLAVQDALKAARIDSLIYVNVLEHIAEDGRELRGMYEALGPGGRIFIFVPALPFLYGSHDRAVGHVRRYRRRELAEKCREAGFAILRLSYFDIAGIVPWWIKYRLLHSSTMEPGAVQLYDSAIVPIMSRLERLMAPPIGKNLVLVGEKVAA